LNLDLTIDTQLPCGRSRGGIVGGRRATSAGDGSWEETADSAIIWLAATPARFPTHSGKSVGVSVGIYLFAQQWQNEEKVHHKHTLQTAGQQVSVEKH